MKSKTLAVNAIRSGHQFSDRDRNSPTNKFEIEFSPMSTPNPGRGDVVAQYGSKQGCKGAGRKWRGPSWITRFLGDRSGSVAMLFGLSIIALFIAIGAAIDFARAVLEKDEAQRALDAATLALVRNYINTQNETTSSAMSKAFVDANMANSKEWTWKLNDLVVTDSRVDVTATAIRVFPTSFMRVAHIDHLPLQISSSASAYLPSVSIVVAPDISYSMRGTKMTAMQDALKAFSESFYTIDQTFQQRFVANLVPFAGSVNVSKYASSHSFLKDWTYRPNDDVGVRNPRYYKLIESTDTVRHTMAFKRPTNGYPRYTETKYELDEGKWVASGVIASNVDWTGCFQVTEQEFNSDAIPTEKSRLPYPAIYTSGYSHCPGADTGVAAGLTKRSDFDAAVDAMQIYYGTSHDTALLWARRLLSPDWSAFFNVPSRPWNDEKLFPKYVIVLSDGETREFYQYGGDHSERTHATARAQAEATCTDLKSKGVTVISISYASATGAIKLMEDCASPGFHYVATEDTVKAVFRDIAGTIRARNLRVVQ